jgi:hypothetical protein
VLQAVSQQLPCPVTTRTGIGLSGASGDVEVPHNPIIFGIGIHYWGNLAKRYGNFIEETNSVSISWLCREGRVAF